MMSAPTLDLEEEVPAAVAARDAVIRDAALRDFEEISAEASKGGANTSAVLARLHSGNVGGTPMRAAAPSPVGRPASVHAPSTATPVRDPSPLAAAVTATATGAGAASTPVSADAPSGLLKEPSNAKFKRAASSLMRGKLKGSGLAAKLAAQLSTSKVSVDQPLISGYNRYSAPSDGYLEGDSSPPHSSSAPHGKGGRGRPQLADGCTADGGADAADGASGGGLAASPEGANSSGTFSSAELVLNLPLDKWLPEADEPFPWMEVHHSL